MEPPAPEAQMVVVVAVASAPKVQVVDVASAPKVQMMRWMMPPAPKAQMTGRWCVCCGGCCCASGVGVQQAASQRHAVVVKELRASASEKGDIDCHCLILNAMILVTWVVEKFSGLLLRQLIG